MTDSTKLERRYRRLLALYPRKFRDEREQEILAVLMEGADDGQQWPRLGEMADLVRRAFPLRLRSLPRSGQGRSGWSPRVVVPVRVLVGLWLLGLGSFFCAEGHWWGAGLYAFSALHFYLAARIVRHPYT
jgi:hypothetical protein